MKKIFQPVSVGLVLIIAATISFLSACDDGESTLRSRLARVYDKEGFTPGDTPLFNLQYNSDNQIIVVTKISAKDTISSRFKVFYGVDGRSTEVVEYAYPVDTVLQVNYISYTNYGFIIREADTEELKNATAYYVNSSDRFTRMIKYDSLGNDQTMIMYWTQDTIMASSANHGYAFVYQKIKSPFAQVELPVMVVCGLYPAGVPEMQREYLPVSFRTPQSALPFNCLLELDSENELQSLEVKLDQNRIAKYYFEYQIYREE